MAYILAKYLNQFITVPKLMNSFRSLDPLEISLGFRVTQKS